MVVGVLLHEMKAADVSKLALLREAAALTGVSPGVMVSGWVERGLGAEECIDDFVDEVSRSGTISVRYWELMRALFHSLGLRYRADMCNHRIWEIRNGFLDAELTLFSSSDGGRSRPFLPVFYPVFSLDVCEREVRTPKFSGAILTNSRDVLCPGDTRRVIVHRTFPERWPAIGAGDRVNVFDGRKQVGFLTVLRVVPGCDP